MLLDRLFHHTVECFKNGCQYSALARAGVMPAVAVRLMRRRDVRTTLQTYTHVEMEQTREALCGLDYGGIKKWRRGELNPRPGFRIGWRLHG